MVDVEEFEKLVNGIRELDRADDVDEVDETEGDRPCPDAAGIGGGGGS